jgi:hypothetical protein
MKSPPSYAALYEAWRRTCRRGYSLQRRYQALVDQRLVEMIRRVYPRRKIPQYPRSDPRYSEAYQELYAAALPRYKARAARTEARLKRLVRLLNYRALRSPVVPIAEERLLYTCSSCDHLSQGFGAAKYAHGDALTKVDAIETAGLTARIEDEDQGISYQIHHHVYRVYGCLDAASLDQIARRPVDLVERVRLCWKRGTNPRVSMPFLPHGFEEKHGLDFFGGRVDVYKGRLKGVQNP